MPIKPKKYDGYKSFQYLEAGKDYRPYELSREYDRVEPFVYPVTEEEEKRVEKIFENNLDFLCIIGIYIIYWLQFERWSGVC